MPSFPRLNRLLVLCGLVCFATFAPAAVINVDTNSSSGRIGDNSLGGVDWQFGTPAAVTAATGDLVAYNNSLLGDNPTNHKFGQLWRFDATSDFVSDFNNGYDVFLQFTSGLINNGGGTGPIDVYFLISGPGAVREDAANSSGTLLDTISGSAQNTFYDIGVTGIPGGLAAGDRIWIGLEADISSNSAANNIFIAGSGSTINAQLATVIPEPSTIALTLGALGAALLIGRRRKG